MYVKTEPRTNENSADADSSRSHSKGLPPCFCVEASGAFNLSEPVLKFCAVGQIHSWSSHRASPRARTFGARKPSVAIISGPGRPKEEKAQLKPRCSREVTVRFKSPSRIGRSSTWWPIKWAAAHTPSTSQRTPGKWRPKR